MLRYIDTSEARTRKPLFTLLVCENTVVWASLDQSGNASTSLNLHGPFAGETFAIETKYGRARCVRQWGNDEHTITDAMASCPVSCIHLVERQKLPALEYVMAQLPRHGVGVEVHSGGGLKRGNVDVFQVSSAAGSYFIDC